MLIGHKPEVACTLLASIALLFVLVAYLVKSSDPDQNQRLGATPSPYQQMIEMANAQILAEMNAENVQHPTVQSAPRSIGAIEGNYRVGVPNLHPPEGYSFVEFDGEMSEDRLEDSGKSKGGATNERNEWLTSIDSIDVLVAQASQADRDWAFGWLRLAEDARIHELEKALQGTDATIIGATGNLIRAKLPGDEARLQAIAGLREIDGLGAIPPELKVPSLDEQVIEQPSHTKIPVFVTLMTDDSDQVWRRELEILGAVVGRFDPTIRVYVASATYESLELISKRDFVLAIEPIRTVTAIHDTAVPAMGADALRMYDGTPGLFSGIGGSTTPIAVMDSGLNTNHLDISTNRGSICGANFVFFEPRIDDHDLWVDEGLHGTHVTGTFIGNGTAEPRYTGMAPLVQHIRFAKVLSHFGLGHDLFILRGMDFLAERTSCPEYGWSAAKIKPLIVNMSISRSARIWEGRGVTERKLDSIVWRHRQLYVVGQSNESISGFSSFSAAKNSLAVGAILDAGSIAGFSSHGPTADGRLAPQVVGTGFELYSATGDDNRDGYRLSSGTSMSTPSVAGVAALLMDAVPSHREKPALTRARIMASAIKPDAWFENAALFPTNNSNGPGEIQAQYGLGKVSARTSVLNRDEIDGWMSSGATSELNDREYAYHDFEIPEGTSRLDVVLTWDEPPTDTLASAVLNDLDLWLDVGGDCQIEICGEYASESGVDNVEWIVVRNPPAGVYRAKVVARRIYTDPPRAALAWTIIRGESTPSLHVSTDRNVITLQNSDEESGLKVNLTTDAYIAAGTRLFIDCRTIRGDECPDFGELHVSTNREDGIDLENSVEVGESIDIGELAVGETWSAQIQFEDLASIDVDAFRLYLKVSAWNANGVSTTVLVNTDGVDVPVATGDMSLSNDLFANASTVEGEQGSVELDLLHARTELGEPVFNNQFGRPAGSAWYEWTAPSNDMVSFNVVPDANFGYILASRVDVLKGDRIASLERIASSDWGVQFFPEARQTYVVRVSHATSSIPLVLNWSSGPRPVNDHFLSASEIDGVYGSVKGTNAGATLEGELFGSLAATVWYRWTAPTTGTWRFKSSAQDLRVLAFTGDRLSALRFASEFPYRAVSLKAEGGATYRIAVASKDAYETGSTFELTWERTERDVGNDDLQNAHDIPSELSFAHRVDIDEYSSVEPGEPLESGIRTKWWSWTAPEDGVYTWRIEELTRQTTGSKNRLMVSMFSGDTVRDLRYVASNGTEMSVEWIMSAEAGEEYSISAGFPSNYQWAFLDVLATAHATLAWGPTPENDRFADASILTGMNGSVTASSYFATTERGERTGRLGHSSLWWKYEVPAAGWYGFWVENGDDDLTFAVYRTANRLASLELVASEIGSDVDITVRADEGEIYVVRVGTRGSSQGSEFVLRWEERDPPASLLYLSQLPPGGADEAGNTVELRNLYRIAFNNEGTTLFLSSELGLQVLARNSETGELTYRQLIEGEHFQSRELLWDDQRERLLAIRCDQWDAFGTNNDDSREFRYIGRVEVPEGHRICDEGDAFIDDEGTYVYLLGIYPNRLQVMGFESADAVRHVQTLEIDELVAVDFTNDDRFAYAVTRGSLITLERDNETGELNRRFSQPLSNAIDVGVSSDDRFLFVLEADGYRVKVFRLANNGLNPEFLDTLRQRDLLSCEHISMRLGVPSVDMFCGDPFDVTVLGGALTVQWRSAENRLVLSGRIIGTDALGEVVPDTFGPVDVETSPDGRHVYVATYEHGILTFERLGN